VRYLIPHGLILLAMVALAGGHVSETWCLVMYVGGHLLVPVWSASIARRDTRTRAIVLGPVLVIAVHAIAIIWHCLVLIGSPWEGTWLAWYVVILWALALVAYAGYCALAFSLVTRARRRTNG
jgi:hypothetical protein